MPTLHLIHPSAAVRTPLEATFQSAGWTVAAAAGRTRALERLSTPLGTRFGDVVLVELQGWAVPGSALVRALRRQAASTLPVMVRLPVGEDLMGLSADAARRAGANAIFTADTADGELLEAADVIAGRQLADEVSRIRGLWQQQCELLTLPEHAAATVVATRQVFEGLLSRRLDERAQAAAESLVDLPGGPVPLARWAGWYHPALRGVDQHPHGLPALGAAAPMCLIFEAGGERYALPMDGPVIPAGWWLDGHQPPHGVHPPACALPLVRLLGSSGFRRLLITDRVTILLQPGPHDSHGGPHRREHRPAPVPVHAPVGLRVDEVLGVQALAIDRCPPSLAYAGGCLGTAMDQDGVDVLVLDGAALHRTLQRINTTDLARFG